MKTFIINYLLFIYITYIEDDTLDIFKDWAKPFIKALMFINNVYIWTFSILFLPIFVLDMKIRQFFNSIKSENI